MFFLKKKKKKKRKVENARSRVSDTQKKKN